MKHPEGTIWTRLNMTFAGRYSPSAVAEEKFGQGKVWNGVRGMGHVSGTGSWNAVARIRPSIAHMLSELLTLLRDHEKLRGSD